MNNLELFERNSEVVKLTLKINFKPRRHGPTLCKIKQSSIQRPRKSLDRLLMVSPGQRFHRDKDFIQTAPIGSICRSSELSSRLYTQELLGSRENLFQMSKNQIQNRHQLSETSYSFCNE